jgi:fumarate reductase flavoprotein subunit
MDTLLNAATRPQHGVSLPVEAGSIAPTQIAAVMATDALVIGGGLSGLCAALSARECGLRVTVIEKGPTSCSNGMAQAAVDSQIQKEAGVVLDRNEIVAELLLASGYRADERLLHLWANKSGACMDWLVDLARAKGLHPRVTEQSVKYLGKTKLFPTGVFFGGNAALLDCLQETARSRDAAIHYNTRAVQLKRDGRGRVEGAFSRNADGAYTFWRADKATLLCSGGFECSAEMIAELLTPRDYKTIRAWEQPFTTATGDGLRMATAVGAALQAGSHALMNGPGALPGGAIFDLAMLPWLLVNGRGERFVQESTPYLGEALLAQLGGFAWTIVDSQWSGILRGKDIIRTDADAASKEGQWKKHLASGAILAADSIEALAGHIGCDAAVLTATLGRYNQMCRTGRDEDFSKPADWLFPVERPPFYAINNGVRGLVTLTGLQVNTELQVLDAAGRIIPDLYAAGNASGGFFAGTYPRNVLGISNGRAFTFGRLAGLNAAHRRH